MLSTYYLKQSKSYYKNKAQYPAKQLIYAWYNLE